jgi:hypothetical protein
MPTAVVITKRLVIRYAEGGSYSFARFENSASDAEIHALALDLNALQAERPPAAVDLIIRSQIV